MPKKKIIRRALVSVSDKTGLIEFAKALSRFKIEILSTGGTLKTLKDAGVQAIPVEQRTGFPEILDGRVKTLHPRIHGGLLFRRGLKSHVRQAKDHDILPIDLVVVNLYPFEEVTQKKGVSLEDAIENIDIGGPSMLRSAAKNYESVTVVCDPKDYGAVLEEMKKNGGSVSKELRSRLAAKVFTRTFHYDAAISHYLNAKLESAASESLPEKLEMNYEKVRDLRYGENPHQRAALYQSQTRKTWFEFRQLHGKELSFNNLLDMEATVDILREFDKPAASVVKHNNPCGIAQDKTLATAMEKAIECDPLSAFGGILGVNFACDKKTAEIALRDLRFFEVFVAPSFDPAALKLLRERKNLRIIETGKLGDGGPYDMRFFKSGILLQDRDKPVRTSLRKSELKIATKAKPTSREIEDLLFAWKCVKTVKSNAIVLTQGRQTVGIGAGQMSRVDSVFMACHKAGFRTEGSYLASDAFFPMPDAIEEAHQHKIRAIIQPGGSIRDADIIAACNQYGIAMVFTGRRHFRH